MTTLKVSFFAVALLASTVTASAQSIGVPSGTYTADKTHTNVLWSVSHFGLSNYIGRFNRVDAKLVLNSVEPAKSKLEASIDPASVDTNYPPAPNDFNIEIASSKFFDAEKFPKITFVSKSIELTGPDTGKVTGDLTFHGVTKPATLDVKLNAALNPHPMSGKPTVGFSATGTIKRSDFGVSAFVGPVSDEVKLTIETEFVPE